MARAAERIGKPLVPRVNQPGEVNRGIKRIPMPYHDNLGPLFCSGLWHPPLLPERTRALNLLYEMRTKVSILFIHECFFIITVGGDGDA